MIERHRSIKCLETLWKDFFSLLFPSSISLAPRISLPSSALVKLTSFIWPGAALHWQQLAPQTPCPHPFLPLSVGASCSSTMVFKAALLVIARHRIFYLSGKTTVVKSNATLSWPLYSLIPLGILGLRNMPMYLAHPLLLMSFYSCPPDLFTPVSSLPLIVGGTTIRKYTSGAEEEVCILHVKSKWSYGSGRAYLESPTRQKREHLRTPTFKGQVK